MKLKLLGFGMCCMMAISWSAYSQDSLMLKTGEKIAFMKLYQYEDSVEIIVPYSRNRVSYAVDDVYGYYDKLNERSYYLVAEPESEGYSHRHIFVERTLVGAIDMYVDNQRDYKMYLSKDDETHLIYRTLEPYAVGRSRIDTLIQLVKDDSTLLDYIHSKEFKFRPRDIELLIHDYNLRNYSGKAPNQRDITNHVFLYRTQFQKTKYPLKIWFEGTPHPLYIKDFIQLDIPLEYPSKITISDGLVSTDMIVKADIGQQYYEVMYDSRTNSYVLDHKLGTELHYEFNKIKDKIGKGASKY